MRRVVLLDKPEADAFSAPYAQAYFPFQCLYLGRMSQSSKVFLVRTISNLEYGNRSTNICVPRVRVGEIFTQRKTNRKQNTSPQKKTKNIK